MLSDRLELAMKEAGVSQAELARACGVKPPSVSGWLSGKSKFLRGENLLSAAKALNVSQAWLATGKGQMRSQPGEESIPLSVLQPVPHEGYITFELLDVQAAAGNGCSTVAFPEVIRQVNVLESWAHSTLGADLSRIRLITAVGDSMEGSFSDKDILFVDITVLEYHSEGIYIIDTPDGLRAKRLQRLMDGSLRILCDNHALYPHPDVVTGEALNSIRICGKVLAAWSFSKLG